MQKSIILGESLSNKLKSIDHPIAHFILKCADDKEQFDVDFSYFDFIKEEGKISFLKNRWEGDGQEFISSRRESMKIGRLIIALAQKKSISFNDKEIEKFVNQYKIFQQDSHFELFKGKTISKWYNEDNYDKSGEQGASLYNSCMRYKTCKTFFTIYEKHTNVSLVCLLSPDKKLLQGRAILWENVDLNGTKISFLDRIYTYKYSSEAIFKDYAMKNGWWFKSKQSNQNVTISNGKDNANSYEIKVNLPSDVNWDSVLKPYMDTLKYIKEDIKNGEVVEYLSSFGDDNNYKQYWTSTSGIHNVNNDYLSIKDSSKALQEFLKTPVNIISPKMMESNNIKYRVENTNSIRRFIKDTIEANPNKFINLDSLNKYINLINMSFMRNNTSIVDTIIKNINHLNINSKIVDYLDNESKFKFIFEYLTVNKKYLRNLSNLTHNRIKILPSLKNHIGNNGWPNRMLQFIGKEYDICIGYNHEYRIQIDNSIWSIPLECAEKIPIGIDFKKNDEDIINDISKIFSESNLKFNNIVDIINNFKVGDKVICININSSFYNVEGVIKEFVNNEIGVAFKENKGGHNLNSRGRAKTRKGYGYYMLSNEIQLLDCQVKVVDYSKFFDTLSEEKKQIYIKTEIQPSLNYDDVKKFDNESLLQIIMSDIRNISDRFDVKEIETFIKNLDDVDVSVNKNFYFFKEKNS